MYGLNTTTRTLFQLHLLPVLLDKLWSFVCDHRNYKLVLVAQWINIYKTACLFFSLLFGREHVENVFDTAVDTAISSSLATHARVANVISIYVDTAATFHHANMYEASRASMSIFELF